MPDLHAPTLRRVIEMLDGEIAAREADAAECKRAGLRKLYIYAAARAGGFRAFRERLERELTTTEAPE